MTAFLASLSPVEWLSIVAASWLILSAVVAVPIGRAMRRAGCGDAAWLDAWPSSVDDVDELDRRFYAIVDSETHWFMDGAA